MIDFFTKNLKDCEERVIRSVLAIYLDREPTIEDAKRTTRYFRENEPNCYELAFDKVLLGKISFEFTPEKVSVNFTPQE